MVMIESGHGFTPMPKRNYCLGRLLSPTTWPSWILLFYRGLDAWGNADFLRGKINALKSFIDSPWAVVLALGFLFFSVFDWHTKLWSRLPLRWKPTRLITKEAITKKDLEIIKLINAVRLLELQANWLNTMISDDLENLDERIAISKDGEARSKHLKDLEPCLTFPVVIDNRTVFKVVLGDKEISGLIGWERGKFQQRLRPLKGESLVLDRGQKAFWELQQVVTPEMAKEILSWKENRQEVEFWLEEVSIPMTVYNPDNTAVRERTLKMPRYICLEN
jgi:hypothetical protein